MAPAPSLFERRPRTTLAVVVLAPFALLELGLRLAQPDVLAFVHAARRVHAYSPRWRVDLVPERTAHLRLAADDGRLLYNFLLTTGELGVRVADRDLDDPPPAAAPGRRLVHCVGDSFTLGWGVAWSDAYPALLDWRLPPDVRAVNLGVDGFGTIAATEKSQALWPRLPAVAAVYLFHPNDVDDDARLLAVRRRGALGHLVHRGADALRRHSYAANLPFAVAWARRFAPLRASRDAAEGKVLHGRHAWLAEPATAPVAPLPGDDAAPSLARLGDYAAWLAERDARLVVLLLEPEDERSRRVAGFCRRRGIEAHGVELPREAYLAREGHLGRLGNEAVARLVARLLGPSVGG